mmetsp:Transcript_38233/g.70529  ORF Transcript_38233/g.70529 Transcript_38233/m.70529 type:complete len:207 (-) Transcript_38233:661-1281(-)
MSFSTKLSQFGHWRQWWWKTRGHTHHGILSDEFQTSTQNVPKEFRTITRHIRSHDYILRTKHSMGQLFHRTTKACTHHRSTPPRKRITIEATFLPRKVLEKAVRDRSGRTDASQGREHHAVRDMGREVSAAPHRRHVEPIQHHAIRMGRYGILEKSRSAHVPTERRAHQHHEGGSERRRDAPVSNDTVQLRSGRGDQRQSGAGRRK